MICDFTVSVLNDTVVDIYIMEMQLILLVTRLEYIINMQHVYLFIRTRTI